MRALVWFRNDLRVADNSALHHAAEHVGPKGSLAAVFLAQPGQWTEHDWSGVKVELIRRTLAVLSRDLRELNIPLLILEESRFSDAPAALAKLARELGCGSLHFNREYEHNERVRDEAVTSAFARAGLEVHAHHDQVLLPPGEVLTGEGRFYTVFTPFKRAHHRVLMERGLQSGPVKNLSVPRPRASLPFQPSEIPVRLGNFESSVLPETWPAGEHAARKRLESFARTAMREYKDRRDLPAEDATSALSPYLSIGAISPRQCLKAALALTGGVLESKAPELAGPVCWISELTWREFYRHIVFGFPRVSKGRAFKPATERIRWSGDHRGFEAWCAGRTGVPIVDAGMRQLRATGWMHNRVRMITAMYLTKDLFIDWRWGERHFMRHLVDGDLAQNNGGWQWSASTGTDAAPYFRIFNPVSQSRRFDAEGAYIRRWVPELGMLEGGEDGPIHDPGELPPLARARLDYPEPIADRSQVKDRVMKAFQALN